MGEECPSQVRTLTDQPFRGTRASISIQKLLLMNQGGHLVSLGRLNHVIQNVWHCLILCCTHPRRNCPGGCSNTMQNSLQYVQDKCSAETLYAGSILFQPRALAPLLTAPARFSSLHHINKQPRSSEKSAPPYSCQLEFLARERGGTKDLPSFDLEQVLKKQAPQTCCINSLQHQKHPLRLLAYWIARIDWAYARTAKDPKISSTTQLPKPKVDNGGAKMQ